jgi:hypothetical protein
MRERVNQYYTPVNPAHVHVHTTRSGKRIPQQMIGIPIHIEETA